MLPPMVERSRVTLPPAVGASYEVYVNGVRQEEGVDFVRIGSDLLFPRSLRKEGRTARHVALALALSRSPRHVSPERLGRRRLRGERPTRRRDRSRDLRRRRASERVERSLALGPGAPPVPACTRCSRCASVSARAKRRSDGSERVGKQRPADLVARARLASERGPRPLEAVVVVLDDLRARPAGRECARRGPRARASARARRSARATRGSRREGRG